MTENEEEENEVVPHVGESSDDDVIVLGGNSPAFRSIVISLTIFLGALIGAVLLYEMVVFFYQRVITKNRTEDIESAGGN